MNANEIADGLDEYNKDGFPVYIVDKAALKLRQQFDTIADLQTTIKFLEEECKALRIQITKGVEMTTWTTEDREALEKGLEFFEQLKGNNSNPPHIVDSGASVMPAKTLTDEEIIEFIKSWEGLVVTNRTMEMFRAILKKASEK